MLRKYGIILIFVLLLAVSVHAEPVISWQKSFGGSAPDQGSSVQQLADGSYILAGTTNSSDGDITGNHGNSDIWVAKIRSTGTIQWKKTIGTPGYEAGGDILPTADGGYILAAVADYGGPSINGTHGGKDFLLMKLSSAGTVQWQKFYGGSNDDQPIQLALAPDGGYIICGATRSADGDVTETFGDSDAWIVRTDSAGSIRWQHSYGTSKADAAFSVQPTSDGGYIVAGTSSGPDSTSPSGWLCAGWVLKIDGNGNPGWQTTIGNSNSNQLVAARQTSDGGYIAGGLSDFTGLGVSEFHGGVDAWLLRLDSAGTVVWQRAYGGSYMDWIIDVHQTSDGGYLAGGLSDSVDGDVTANHGMGDIWLLRTDSNGNLLWQRTLGGSGYDTPTRVPLTSDGGFIVTGISSSNDGDISGNHGGNDILLVKFRDVPLPSVNFTANRTTGNIPLAVKFTDRSTGTPTAWNWSFGDGTFSDTRSPTHTYTEPGVYTVTLTATNAGGSRTLIRADYINASVPPAPVAKFTANRTSGTAPQEIAFMDRSTGTPTAWDWDFGDGTISAEKNPVHIFNLTGKYTVVLTVSNDWGTNTSVKSNYITIS